jgi:hypothetical protein
MSGTHLLAGSSLLLILLLVAAAAAQGSGSLTRGNTFTVTVIGKSRTAYDIWPRGTSDMTGTPGDQPPIIVPGQVDVVQDPPGGPYAIGSTPISGTGLTILEDVARSTPVVPSTSYYARVTTDAGGRGVVLFQTSSATATDREFHIVAQNPADPGKEVQVVLGVPEPVRTPVMPPPLPTTMETPLMSPLATTAITMETPHLPPPTPASFPPPSPPVPSTPALPAATVPGGTPIQGTPLPGILATVASGIGVLVMGRKPEG